MHSVAKISEPRTILPCPFPDEGRGPSGKTPFQGLRSFDREHGFEATVHRVEVRRPVIRVVHVDQDTVELRDPGHRCFHRGTLGHHASLAMPSSRGRWTAPELVLIRQPANGFPFARIRARTPNTRTEHPHPNTRTQVDCVCPNTDTSRQTVDSNRLASDRMRTS